jgi:hypothetical protein
MLKVIKWGKTIEILQRWHGIEFRNIPWEFFCTLHIINVKSVRKVAREKCFVTLFSQAKYNIVQFPLLKHAVHKSIESELML